MSSQMQTQESYLQRITHSNYIVRDHTVHQIRTLPGVTLLDMVYRLCLPYMGTQAVELRNILFIQPIVTSSEFDQEVNVTFISGPAHTRVKVTSRKVHGDQVVDPEWQANMECELHAIAAADQKRPPRNIQETIERSDRTWEMDDIYAVAREADIYHDTFMKTLGTVYRHDQEEIMELRLGELAEKYRSKFYAHPAFLDGSTFAGYSFRLSGERTHLFDDGKAYIPFMIGRFCIYKQLPSTIYTYTRRHPKEESGVSSGRDVFTTNLEIRDSSGELLVEFEGLTLKRIRELESIQRLIKLEQDREPASPNSIISNATTGTDRLDESNRTSNASRAIGTASSNLSDSSRPEDALSEEHTPLLLAESYLREQIGAVLSSDPASINPQTGFYELGLDSTQLLGLVKVLEQRLETQLYPTLMFEYPTIERLSVYLAEQYQDAFQWAELDQAGNATPADQPTSLKMDAGSAHQLNTDQEEVSLLVDQQAEPYSYTQANQKSTDDHKLLLYRREWQLSAESKDASKRDRFRQQEGSHEKNGNTPPARQVVWLLGSASQLMDSLNELLPAEQELEFLSLDLGHEHLPIRLEELCKQVLEQLQLELQQRTPKQVRFLIVADSEEELGHYAAALEPMLKTASLEQPRLKGKVLLVEGVQSKPLTELSNIIQRESESYCNGEETVWYRGTVWERQCRTWVSNLKDTPQLVSSNQEVGSGRIEYSYRPQGVYLITGGLGGLGLTVAEHIATRCPVRLALVGRSALRDKQEQRIQLLRERGSEVLVLQADIGSEADVEAVIRRVKSEFGAINGIIHSAGIIKDEYIVRKNTAELQEVFHPKVRGLYALDQASRKERLDFFVLFSSISAVIGNIGQADYAAANAVMDVFAERRQALVQAGERHGTTLSINWPLWAHGGMRIGEQMEELLFSSSGLRPLTNEMGLRALDESLAVGHAQSIVLYGDEQTICKTFLGEHMQTSEASAHAQRMGIEVSYGPDDIAIIGLSGRYPLARDTAEFERNLRSKRDCITGFPEERWEGHSFGYEVDQFYAFGGFVEDIDKFDPLFFNMSPRQAETTDPQARLFLQAAWEACEDAGFEMNRSEHHYASNGEHSVGVFAGVFWSHYEMFGADMAHQGVPMSFGSSPAAIANLVSYSLNLHGPSMAVDTMCSSSLTAIHLARESIRSGECHFALAGGVNLVTHPHKYMFLKQAQFLSSDGRCRSFGEGGDGYVPGEGVGAVLLTTVARAEREGYPIYGVIKGSAVNHVGRTSGSTVPDPIAQAEVIKEALTKSSVHPRTISYVEAHGTGTSLGDPIEIQGLNRAYSAWTSDKQYCAIGSSKSNIGHLEAAAGIAGLSKLLLQFKHGEIFPTIHSENVNPYIPFADTPFYLEREGRSWERPEVFMNGESKWYSRRAGLSSFGAFGSNAHLVLEEYIPLASNSQHNMKDSPVIVPLSARNEERLHASVVRLLNHLTAARHTVPDDMREGIRTSFIFDAIQELSILLEIPVGELDPAQHFVDQNVDQLLRHRLFEQLAEKWGMTAWSGYVYQACSIEELVDLLLIHESESLAAIHNEAAATAAVKPSMESSISLASLAYTLQVGREPMAARLACVVQSLDELVSKLSELAAGHMPTDCYRSERSASPMNSSVHLYEQMSRDELCAVAEQWTQGARMNWPMLYTFLPQRIHLPTYPFEANRYWIPAIEQDESAEVQMTARASSAYLHPLLHRNTSDLTEQRYSSCFDGSESFLADHVIQGRSVLPASACLEMARAAVYEAARPLLSEEQQLTFKHVVWTRPIVKTAGEIDVHIALYPEENGEISFEIYDQDSASSNVQGGVAIGPKLEQPTIQHEPLLEQVKPSKWIAEQYYEAFRQAGLEYGQGHRCIEQVYLGTAAAMVKLRLPMNHGTTALDLAYMLHPGLLDASLQATLPLMAEANVSPDLESSLPQIPLAVPYALQELRMYGQAEPVMWAYVRLSESGPSSNQTQTFDIDVYNEAGCVLWSLQGLSARTLLPGEKVENTGVLIFEPTWQVSKAAMELSSNIPWTRHDILICGLDDVDERRLEAFMSDVNCHSLRSQEQNPGRHFQHIAIQLLAYIQQILTTTGTEKVLLQAVIPSSERGSLLAGLSGMLKTAQLEHPRLLWQIVEVEAGKPNIKLESSTPSLTELAAVLKQNAELYKDGHVRYRDGQRYVRGWQVQEQDRTSTLRTTSWRNNGVYLITGGAGGLGLIMAEEIICSVERPIVIMSGRSRLEKSMEERLEALRAKAPLATIAYMQSDVSNEEQVANLVQDICSRYGTLHGIIHCAGVAKDSYIMKKTPSELEAVFAAKVMGTIHLDQATRHLPLDLFVIFGSLAGAIGNAGQADYSAANAFVSVYASLRAEAVRAGHGTGRTLTIDWPLWQAGGMAVDAGNEERLRHSLGIVPMRTASGIQALYDGLSLPSDHVLVLEGDIEQMRARVLGTKKAASMSANHSEGANGSAAASAFAADDIKEDASSELAALVAAAMEDTLAKLVSELLKVKPHDIEPQLKLSDYGFDSVTFTELTNRLNGQFKVDLTPAIFFEYATIESFARYMAEEYLESLLPSLPVNLTRLGSAVPGGPSTLEGINAHQKPQSPHSRSGNSSILNIKPSSKPDPAREESLPIRASQAANKPQHWRSTLSATNHGISLKQHEQQQHQQDQRQYKQGDDQHPHVQHQHHRQQTRHDFGIQSSKSGKVAIIGMSGKFPMADSLNELWTNLMEGKDCITEIPSERWDWKAYYGDPTTEPNKTNVRWGGFLNGIDEFDPQFFGISPREAELMDPQQRLLMTYAWKAIEDSGYSASSLSGTDTGIFVGTASSGYGEHIYRAGMSIEGYTSTGSVPSVGPNRLSYFLDLHGPSEPIETACSSSLVAVDRAVTAIQNGSCRMAIVGGVNTILSPEPHISFNKAGMLSEDGRCKTFSATANGYVRGEGVGMLVLKALEDAEADGDSIYGVIRATAVNHGGRAQSLTAPNPKAQAALLQSAYRKAGIDPRTITYIEAHGTGTELGDPIEINGLKAAFHSLYEEHGLPAPTAPHCGLGSIKTNIGHLELAAGVAGIMKILLQLKHRTLVSSLHCEQVNPYIQLHDSPFYIVQQNREWAALHDDQGQVLPRRAGVSSFGFGGVNAHAVIEEYIPTSKHNDHKQAEPVVMVFSARNEERLHDLTEQWLGYLEKGQLDDSQLTDAAYTMQLGRDAFEERLAIVASSVKELHDKLSLFVEDKEEIPGVYRGHAKRNREIMSIFADEDLKSAVEKWFSKGKQHKLAEIWTRGLELEWMKLYRDAFPQRISLPTYPFSRERYWAGMRKQARSERGADHRLVERPIETLVSQRHPHSEVPDLNRPAASDTPRCVSIREDEPSSAKPTKIKLQPLTRGTSWRESTEPVANKTMVTLQDLSETVCQEEEQTLIFNATERSAARALSEDPHVSIPAAVPVADSMTDLHKHETRSLAEQLQAELTASLAEALYLHEADIDADKPFIDLGLDSIIGVEWMRSVNHHYGTAVPATKVYDYPNIRELAAYFASQLLQMEAYRRSKHDIEDQPAVTEHKVSADLSYRTISHEFTSRSVQKQAVLEQLAASLADALYLSTEHLDMEAKFIDLGLDSIVGIEWLRAINRDYGTDITIAKLYDHPTLSDLAKYLESQLCQSAPVLSDHALSAVNNKESRDSNQSTLDDILQQVQAGRLDIQQAEQLLIALGGI